MRFIHCADIHFGSKIESKLKDISESRKAEVLTAFNQMLDYANKEKIKLVVLAGDVFDKENPRIKDKDFFYNAIKANPTIDFLYLRGNHDSSEYFDDEIPNLKMFKDEWTSFTYDNVSFSGIEINATNKTSLYSTLKLRIEDKNVVIMHGELADNPGLDKVCLKKLKYKGIDYLALGHIHAYLEGKIDERGYYVNPGCLLGRSFDELGEKSFVVVDVKEEVSYQKIRINLPKIVEEEIDITGKNNFEALNFVQNNLKTDCTDILRINLVGDIAFDAYEIMSEIVTSLKSKYRFVTVKNKTKTLINYKNYENDLSLRGEFVRTVHANCNLTEERQKEIIMLGLKALSGREID